MVGRKALEPQSGGPIPMKSFTCPCGAGICSYDPGSKRPVIAVMNGQLSVVDSRVAARLIDDSPFATALRQLDRPGLRPAEWCTSRT